MSKQEEQSASKNHEQAPICAAFVKEMRSVFGDDVKVLWVREGSFELGERSESEPVA
jgi:hypothetical protein